MADYTPPTENLPIFDPTVFLTGDEPLTYNTAVKKFLKYPNAQGTENLQAINVNGVATFKNNVVVGSSSSSNNTPTITTYKSLLNLGQGGQGDINVECPISIGGFGSIQMLTSNINMQAGSYIVQVGMSTPNTFGVSNFTAISNYSGVTQPAPTDNSTKIPSTSWVQSAISSSISSVLPTGSIIPYSGVTAPTGFLLCDGSNVSTTTYSALYAVVGTTYGIAPSGTFTIPNLLSKIPMGSTTSGTQGVLYYTGSLNVVGVYGGNQTMNASQVAGHTHTLSFPTSNYIDNVNSTSNTTTGGTSTRLVSGNSSSFPPTTGQQNIPATQADLLPPFCAVTYIIKY